ncbi:MAG: 23S rRNA methyltransferase [Gammaproteobacteria bacterium]|nr:23S rRNA methyltransferase [Gammaproteobacteria bacterium]
MSRKSSSARWKARQARDPFVKRAQAEGWRSRAVFKLSELQGRERLIKPGSVVIDLGAAPGAWSQFAADVVGGRGRVLAVDLLPMAPLAGVEILQGDFGEEAVMNRLLTSLAGTPVDLVLSDMAPNMSGTRVVDQPRAMHLAELAADFASQVLRPGGNLVVKLFQGEGFQEYVEAARARFASVRLRKPAASRSGNRETYLVARNFRL